MMLEVSCASRIQGMIGPVTSFPICALPRAAVQGPEEAQALPDKQLSRKGLAPDGATVAYQFCGFCGSIALLSPSPERASVHAPGVPERAAVPNAPSEAIMRAGFCGCTEKAATSLMGPSAPFRSSKWAASSEEQTGCC